MLHIFLVILKIIGILLAALLGIILILILCVLFCPVRYRVEGAHYESWTAKARINFLGPIIWFRILYDEQLSYKLRVFGIPVFTSDKQSSNQRKKAHKKTRKTSILDEEEEFDETSDLDSSEEQTSDSNENNNESKQENGNLTDSHNRIKTDTTDENDTVQKEQISFGQRIADFFKNIIDKIKSLFEKVKKIIGFIGKFKEFCQDEGVKTGLTVLKSEVWLLLKKIRPRKLKLRLKIGFEDPSTTGQLLGVLAVLRSMWEQEMQVEPDFEHKVFETEFQAKGFIQGFRILRLGWKCLFHKDIKYLFSKITTLRSES